MSDTEKRLGEIQARVDAECNPHRCHGPQFLEPKGRPPCTHEDTGFLLATVRGQAHDLKREKKYRLDDEKELSRMDDVEHERDGWKGEFESLQRKYDELKMDTCLKRYRLLQAENTRLRETAES